VESPLVRVFEYPAFAVQSLALYRMLMAAGEGSILAGPVGTTALMFIGGEGSSQS
jgi:hypothetical protein